MFDFLKKKIGGFVGSIIKQNDGKIDEGLAVNTKAIKNPSEEARPSETQEFQKPITSIPETKPILVDQPQITPLIHDSSDNAIDERSRVKLGALGIIKSIVLKEVSLSDKELEKLLDDFELELLEADVDLGVAEIIKNGLRSRLGGIKIERGKLQITVNAAIKETLLEVITNDKYFDLFEKISSSQKPFKMMFIGINGAGKTTTIAKIASILMKNNNKVIFAAADTFRAAAIEQLSVHAERLGIKVIKRDYGSDPTSVAFDALNYARAHGLDAVLIDTAGRQDTNVSLINEVKKMVRVIKPDLKIYVGESIAGNAILEQISSFKREIGLDAVILTKMDCDPKGGTMLSISSVTGIPIIYLGVGQKYEDLEPFNANKIVERIVS